MAIPHLTDQQIQEWTREQKDRWWLEKVFRGDMPQLTLRSGVTGFLLGGILSATNLYVGAKTGWTLGVGLTSVILAFAAFRIMATLGAKDMTILENNCSQSIATAAGYMTGPLISGMAAYMWVENRILFWGHIMGFSIVLSILGVLVAFPMKRKFINDEQQPFPEGRACGVVLDALYTASAAAGMFKAKVLALAAGLAGFLQFLMGGHLQALVQGKLLGVAKEKIWHLPHYLDGWYYGLAEKGVVPVPKLANVDIRQLGLQPGLDLAMIGAGGLLGFRSAWNMLLGMAVNFVVLVPLMIANGQIAPRADGSYSRVHVVNNWALWWGVVIMVVASMVSLFAKPKVFVQAFRALRGKKAGDAARSDALRHIELPLWVSFTFAPIVGAVGVWMAQTWFGVSWVHGTLALLLIVVLTLIAATSTAMTAITPTGSLSKIPQFIFGAANPKHPPTNLMTAVMCTEVASNASNLLMDIKPGYMLGAKPRQQAIGHVIGIFAGAIAATPLFFLLFLPKGVEAGNVQETMVSDQFSFPSALQWKGVCDLVTSIFGGEQSRALLSTSIVWSMVIAAVVGLVFEILRTASKNKFPFNPLAIGLGVVIPPESTIAMFAGSAFFAWMGSRYKAREKSFGHELWVECHEPICAGLIAGAALMGIADILVGAFVI